MTLRTHHHGPFRAGTQRGSDYVTLTATDRTGSATVLFFPDAPAAHRWLRAAHEQLFPPPQNVRHPRHQNTRPEAHA